MKQSITEEELNREPTREEIETIMEYASVGVKHRYVAAKLGISVEILLRNKKYRGVYEKCMAEAIKNTMSKILECVESDKTAKNAQVCINILQMWGIGYNVNSISSSLSGTYKERMNSLDTSLAKQEISVNEYKELALVQSERFKYQEIVENYDKLNLVVSQITELNKKLIEENDKLKRCSKTEVV